MSFLGLAPIALAQSINPQDQERREQERLEQRRELLEPDRRVQLPGQSPSGRKISQEALCFDIRSIQITGAEDLVLPSAWLESALAGDDDTPLGRCIGADGVGVLISRLQDALVAQGFVTTRVLAPAQQLSQGSLVLTVIPGRIRAITGDFPSAGVAPPLQAGAVLNLRHIEQALEAMQRVPTASADIQIEAVEDPALGPGFSDVVVRWSQAKKWRATVTLDDSGNKATGQLQSSATLSLDNLLGINDLLYVTYGSSAGWAAEGARGNRSQTVHYSAPVGLWLLSATTSQSRFHQSVAGANQTYVYSGDSSTAQVQATTLVHRDGSSRTNAYVRAFVRSSKNYIDDTEVQVQRRRVGGWELGLDHKATIGRSNAQGSVLYRRGTGAFGSLPAPEENFGEGTSRFAIVAADASIATPWQLGIQKGQASLQWRGQWNRTPLTPQDRFAIGGRYTVRGFSGEQVLLAERGWVLRSEVSTQLGDYPLSAYAGLDHGQVGGPSADLLAGKRLTGAVVGLRGNLLRTQWEVFVGQPLAKPDRLQTPRTTGGFSLVWSY